MLVVGDVDDLAEDLFDHGPAILIIATPLQQHLLTPRLDLRPRFRPAKALKKAVVIGVAVPDVRQNGKVHAKGQRELFCIAHRVLGLRTRQLARPHT